MSPANKAPTTSARAGTKASSTTVLAAAKALPKANSAKKAAAAVKKATAKPAEKKAAARPVKATGSSKVAPAKVAPAKVTAKVPPAKKTSVAKAAPARQRAPVGPYATDTKFLEEQRVALVSERGVYQEQAEALKAEADSLAQEREPGDVQFDEESGEGGTVTVDRERDLALSAQASAAVEEIEDALVRIQKKTYGACERCHQPIMKARLRALPYARLCVACKSGGLSRR